MTKAQTFIADKIERLDSFLSHKMSECSRSSIQKLILAGNITVNACLKKANYKLKIGDTISVNLPPPQMLDLPAENIPLDILYEDSSMLVINKQRGLVVHPAPHLYTGTLVNALLYYCPHELSGINGVIRPGIVHRLDKDTTGVMVVAKTDTAHLNLAEQIGSKRAIRTYLALVQGIIREENGQIDKHIGRHPLERKKMAVVSPEKGKNATTLFRVLKRYPQMNCTLVECRLLTGRTHQIRVHMASIGHPLIGDPVYKKTHSALDKRITGQALHSHTLTLQHPETGKLMSFTAPLPNDLQKLLNYLDCTLN